MPTTPTHLALRTRWHDLYTKHLPHLALTKSPKQPSWPVHLDHCFARIIYDAVIGEGAAPWPTRLKSPATKNMSEEQLRDCIEMGEAIAEGRVDLVDADERSLKVRGKKGKRKREELDVEDGQPALKKSAKKQADIRTAMHGPAALTPPTPPRSASPTHPTPLSSPPTSEPGFEKDDISTLQHLITTSHLPSIRQRVLLALLQVPRGRVTTYGALAAFLKTSARAVGSAMRNNPFAPGVPCHRVVAAGGKVGGFGGEVGEGVGTGRGKMSKGEEGEGGKIAEKRRLLREEGVRFDGRGRVVGRLFTEFKGVET